MSSLRTTTCDALIVPSVCALYQYCLNRQEVGQLLKRFQQILYRRLGAHNLKDVHFVDSFKCSIKYFTFEAWVFS